MSTALVPYLAVRDARAALAWYADAFGAHRRRPLLMDGDRIGHAELEVAGATVYLADEYPEHGAGRTGATAGSASPCTSSVPDVDAAVDAGRAVGATRRAPGRPTPRTAAPA